MAITGAADFKPILQNMSNPIMTMRPMRACDFAEKFQAGKLIYSDFQRDYFWSKKSVLDFLNAMYRPLILPTAFMVYENVLPFPPGSRKSVPVGDGIWRVVDGKQRLETLFRIARNEEGSQILFNPYEEKFQFKNLKNQNNGQWFPLADLISREVSQVPRVSIDHPDHFEVNVALLKAHGIFRSQEYPCIHVLGYSYQEAKETFLTCNRIRRKPPIQ